MTHSLRSSVLAFSVVAFCGSSIIGLWFSLREYGRIPGPLTDHFEQANRLAFSGNRRQAMQLFKQYTRTVPENHVAWHNLATLQQAAGDWTEARRSWKRALAHGSTRKALVYERLGLCAWELGRKAESEVAREAYWNEAYEEFRVARSYGAGLQPEIESFMEHWAAAKANSQMLASP